MRTEGQADMTKLTVAIHSFANEPENVTSTIGMAGAKDYIDLAQDNNGWRALV